MPVILYFGDRKEEFEAVSQLLTVKAEALPFDKPFDIIVIDGEPNSTSTVPTGVVGVVGSHNKKGLECLMRSGVRTVTCGMARRDTVTLSSSVSDITVCLQRRLPSLAGGILEPGEYIVQNSTDDYILLLLVSATRLLSGLEPI
jgi:hypothetical protein